jgi:hypothetical protein
MAKKNRVDLNAVIQSNLPDNTTDFITPALDREVEIDEIDSCFNLEDDTAVDVNYTPTTPADWGIIPTEVAGSLDELASRVEVLELSPSLVRQIPFYVNTGSTTSNIVATYGTVALFGAERKTSKLLSVAYETSVDGGDTWIARANFGALQTFMNSAISTSFIYIRAVAPVFLGGFEGEQEFILEYN